MALSASIIRANALLAPLTNEQVEALVTLSTNDEATQLGNKIGELHGRYDADILSVTGIAKNQGEKSYDYTKRVLGEYIAKLKSFDNAAAEISQLKKDKTELEAKLVASGGDAAVKQKLKDAEDKLTALQKAYDDDKNAFEIEKAQLISATHLVKVENKLDAALAGLKFKAAIPETVKAILIKNAKADLLSTASPEFSDTGELIFRDKAGAIMNNPGNKLSPYTATELLTKSLADAIEVVKTQPGAGSGPTKTPLTGATTVDISSARTQVEADELIQKHLLDNGMLKTDPAFGTEQNKLRTELEVGKLPIR